MVKITGVTSASESLCIISLFLRPISEKHDAGSLTTPITAKYCCKDATNVLLILPLLQEYFHFIARGHLLEWFLWKLCFGMPFNRNNS